MMKMQMMLDCENQKRRDEEQREEERENQKRRDEERREEERENRKRREEERREEQRENRKRRAEWNDIVSSLVGGLSAAFGVVPAPPKKKKNIRDNYSSNGSTSSE